ncbi:helix-turn-helix transcriptional regulator [Dasania marina]|uniref:helix-turn-helix transcriptional regulator n=1 Tax=Dasania marina TaxID=471499 RepID=UPI0030DB27C9|tara:strand:- start:94467 stop:95357 length:891 start_codon:yes stop_codon:yes gene_type:complete
MNKADSSKSQQSAGDAALTKEWHIKIGGLIDEIGSDDFCKKLIAVLSWLVPFEQVVIISYKQGYAPLFLFDNVKNKEKNNVISTYSQGAYLLDPWYEVAKSGVADGTYRLADVVPDEFFCSDFYQVYYRNTSLKDEINYIFTIESGEVVEISLGRLTGLYNNFELQQLKCIESVILSLCKKHWSAKVDSTAAMYGNKKSSDTHRQVVNVLNNFGVSLLTGREREVAVLMLRGHSLKSVGFTLNIAMGTVKVHCKNLYSKLGLGSMSELFSLFIEVLACPEANNAEDPLKEYLNTYK